jgi:mono/diheme cytochrome c family protein
MKRSLLLFLFAAWPYSLSAQGDDALDDTQKLGQRLFGQSCVVCHAKPQITSGQYGPVLSQATLNGNGSAMRDVISNGTPHMPGFKIQYQPIQIDAIVAYLKTIPVPVAPARPAGRAGNANDD